MKDTPRATGRSLVSSPDRPWLWGFERFRKPIGFVDFVRRISLVRGIACVCSVDVSGLHAHPYKNKNIAYDPQLQSAGAHCGTAGYPQAVRHGDGGRTHTSAVSGLVAAHVVHVDQWAGLRRIALESAALLAGERLAGVVAGAGGVAGDSGCRIRFGDTRSPGATHLAPHVFAGLGRERPDPGGRRHRPGAHRQFSATSLGIWPDWRRHTLGQRRLCGKPAGLLVLYLAVSVTRHWLSVLGR
ncbi:hypothetical protein D3C85_914860 [compost metagenome]